MLKKNKWNKNIYFFLTKKIIKQNIKVIRRHLVSEKEKQKTNYQMSVPLKGKKKGRMCLFLISKRCN